MCGAPSAAAVRQPSQRREHCALNHARRKHCLHLGLELAQEQRKVEWFRDSAQHGASLLGKAHRSLEQAFHLERGPNFDPHDCVRIAGVGEIVRHPGANEHAIPRAGSHSSASKPEAHRSVDDREALVLPWVNVPPTGHTSARRECELDRDELAVGICRGL